MPGEGFIFVVLRIVDIITHHLAQEGSSKKTNYLYKICHKATCAKYFIAAFSKVVNLIVIDRNENHPVFGKHISCKYQPRIYHRAPIRMKARIAVVVLSEILILVLVKEAGLLVIVLLVHFKVVVIDEVVTGVVWWVYMIADFDTIEKDLSSRKMTEKGTKTGLPWSIPDFGSPVLLYEFVRAAA